MNFIQDRVRLNSILDKNDQNKSIIENLRNDKEKLRQQLFLQSRQIANLTSQNAKLQEELNKITKS